MTFSFIKFSNTVDYSSFGTEPTFGVACRGIEIRFPTGAGN